ncbi:glucosaminidase domain-containing protein [Mariniflexile sp.]|uniref:glucosaminidase domain-containing protein n=1 Tax=Mariniflexile sp. TaxID=1979402 RepID=UPI004048D446
MKRIIMLCLLACFVFSCGTKKVAVKKKTSNKQRTEQVSIRKLPKETRKVGEEVEEVVNGVAVKIASTEDYIAAFKTVAQEEMRLYGIPASITIAQGILESNSGKGRLSVEANNHFGIKCHDWTGERIFHDDDADQECFRKYNDAKYSYRDHSLFLSQRSRYAALFKLKKEDYKGWAKELRKAGYATDKKYPDKLIDLIERYGLNQFDEEVLGNTYVKFEEPIYSGATYFVEKGDSMYSISKKFNLTVKELQDLNNLKSSSLSIGQELRINRNSEDTIAVVSGTKSPITNTVHIVGKGETLYSISKKYNISINELQQLNGLNDTGLSVGQRLKIKNQ